MNKDFCAKFNFGFWEKSTANIRILFFFGFIILEALRSSEKIQGHSRSNSRIHFAQGLIMVVYNSRFGTKIAPVRFPLGNGDTKKTQNSARFCGLTPKQNEAPIGLEW